MVIILRGPSGAGKSTLATGLHGSPGDKLWEDSNPMLTRICSADDHFMVRGEYRFVGAELPKAHGNSLKKFVQYVVDERNGLIVDNTNTTIAEVAPYAALALAYGHRLRILTVNCGVSIAAARNIHGVSEDVIAAQVERLEASLADFPPWWPHEFVEGT